MDDLTDLTRRMNCDSKDQSFNAKNIENTLGIKLASNPIQFKAKVLEAPKILFGNNDVVSAQDGSFNLNRAICQQGEESTSIAIVFW